MNKLTLLLALSLQACATTGMLPNSSTQVDFDGVEGKTGWSQYQQAEIFHNYSVEQVYDAAKVGLGTAGFSLIEANKSKGFVSGEHGMTLHDWNIIGGVYFKQIGEDTKVKVIIEGSKDIGFSGDVTGDGWAGKILKGMREHLNDTYQSILKVKKSDIK
jgi:hypothetical protein